MMIDNQLYPCSICNKNVLVDAIECSICKLWVHRKCSKLTKIQLRQLSEVNQMWYCEKSREILPFNQLDDDELIFENNCVDLINVNISNIYRKF